MAPARGICDRLVTLSNLYFVVTLNIQTDVAASVAQLDARPIGDQEVAGSAPLGLQHSFLETDHEIFSTVILSLLLIQEGQLSVSGKRMRTILVNGLED